MSALRKGAAVILAVALLGFAGYLQLSSVPEVYDDADESAFVDRSGSVAVIVAVFGEKTGWIKNSPYPVTLMTKRLPPGTPNNTPGNPRGKEAVSYLQYILDYYDVLPDRMVFLHGHQESWHMEKQDEVLKRIDVWAYPYVGLSKRYNSGLTPWDHELLSDWWNVQVNLTRWIDTPFPDSPDGFRMVCCAAFVVSKERVLAHPKEMYQALYDWLLITASPGPGRLFEWTWHVIFGQPFFDVLPLSKKLCPSNPRACLRLPLLPPD